MVRQVCLEPLLAAWSPVSVQHAKLFYELTAARLALGLATAQFREIKAANAHDLVFKMMAFFVLLWNQALSGKDAYEIPLPPELVDVPPADSSTQALDHFLRDARECLDSFNLFELEAELCQEFVWATEKQRGPFPTPKASSREPNEQRGGSPLTRRPSKIELNVSARDYLASHPDAKRAEVAKAIGCGVRTLVKLPAWRAVSEERKKRRKSPKVVSLTPRLQATQGQGQKDQVLHQLIEEQKADYEISPLDEDPPAERPHRVRTRKRL
jgi:hypothetical protein